MRVASKSDAVQGDFRQAAATARRKRRSDDVSKPFSIRLSEDERAVLLREAGKVSLAAHIRRKLFGAGVLPPRRRPLSRKSPSPSADRKVLGQILAALGQSNLSANLATIAKAASMGALPVTPELSDELHRACGDIRAMREALMKALGLKSGSIL